MYSPNVIRYGREEPLPVAHTLRAGPLTMLYENGFLRRIRFGSHEVLRMIYHAVRDHNWATAPCTIEEETIDQQEDSFRIRYSCRCATGPIDFRWHCEIIGEPDGTLQFSIDGQAHSEFRRNRVGFCVLHPVQECAGELCLLTHPDGSRSQAVFPVTISPHQPFLNIREMEWPVAVGGSAVLWFVGDVFETEDQRNWSDASYKTYCTPLSRPFPVTLQPGDRVQQTLELRLKIPAAPGLFSAEPVSAVTIETGSKAVPIPPIGLSVGREPFDEDAVLLLKKAHIHHLRVEIDLREPNWPADFRKAVGEARAVGAGLELVLFFNQLASFELYGFLKEITDHDLIYSVLLLSNFAKTTPASLIEQVEGPLRQALPQALIGAGTNAFYTELNRFTPPAGRLDFFSYSINPQAHAFDNRTLVENLEAQADSVRDTHGWISRVHVSPVTFRPRFNPDATGDDPVSDPTRMPFAVDPRQMSLFGAAWTVGSLKRLIQAGADSITYFEAVGEKGILQGSSASRFTGQFHAAAGTVFPVYWVLRAVNEFRNGSCLPTTSSDPLRVESLHLTDGHRNRLILCNLTSELQTVIRPVPGPVSVRVLDESVSVEAGLTPAVYAYKAGKELETGAETLTLEPYAVWFLDF
ncbi:hypothetical protein [Larkinella soli]|uniref:hypothetical protein n=1 Tax=Larkinella soli TaxID=1770527 RepID=UPI000FFC11F8|nr:hypothetical protein [Larkinella soli]